MSDETRTQIPLAPPVSGTEPERAIVTVAGNRSSGDAVGSDPLTVAQPSGTAVWSGPNLRGTVPGYEVMGELGRGAMGVVYKARHTKMNRMVALKMALGGQVSEKDLIRFLAEAQSVASVKHDNVVQVYDYGESGGYPYMALEFCSGGSLAERLRDEDDPLGPKAAARMVACISAGVAAAHEAGIVHRDLKPGNVLLDDDGEPKVADFGLAKRGASELTATQAVMGTPAYMSPEQAGGKTKFVGPQADVWALGVILYEMLVGSRPFPGNTTDEVLAGVLHADPPAVRTVKFSVPRDLDLICRKCLEKNPADRYPSAAELSDDLERFGRGEPISARPLGLVSRTVRWARRNPVVAGLMGVVVLITLGLIGSLYVQYKQALAQAGTEREAKEGAERERANAVRAEEAERQRAQAEVLAARSVAEAAQANVLVELLNDMFRSSDPLAIFFGESPPVIGAGGVSEGQAAILGPFLRNAAERFRKTLTGPAVALIRAKLLSSIGNGMKNLGMYSEAKAILEESLQLRRANLSETNPDVWRSEMDLALVEAEGGDLLVGIKRFREVIELQQRAGADPAAILTTKLYLGIALTTTGLVEAGPVLKEVVREREKLLGPGHKDTLFAKLGLIAWYLDHKGELEMGRLFTDIRAHVLAIPDMRTRTMFEAILNVQAQLVSAHIARGLAWLSPGSFREKVNGMKDSLVQLEKVFPEDHLILCIFRFELGKLLIELDEGRAADEQFVRVLVGTQKTVGVAHPKFLVFLQTYAWRLANTNRVAEARALFDEIEAANRLRFTDDNPWRTAILLQRAEFEKVQGDPVKALACAKDAIVLLKRDKFLPTHGALLDLYDAAKELSTGTPAMRVAAREMFAALRPLVEKVHGPTSEEMVEVLIAEGKRAYESGDRATAAPAFEQARKIVTEEPKPWENKFHLTDALHWCGQIELDRGRLAEAEALFRATREASKSVPGYKDRARQDIELLAKTLAAQGRYAEATTLFEEVRKLRGDLKLTEAGLAWGDLQVATNQLAAGERADYLKTVDKMFQQHGKSVSVDTLSRLAWAGGLSAKPEGWVPAEFEAQYATALKPVTNYPWGYQGLALVRLRAGKLGEADEALGKVGSTVHPLDHLIRGLAAVARKDIPRARVLLANAERLIEAQKPNAKNPFAYGGRFWHKDVEVAILLTELRDSIPTPALAPPPREVKR